DCGIMAGTDHAVRDRPHDGQCFLAVGILVPLFISADVIRDGKADSVAYILPISAAEHLKVVSLSFKHKCPFDRMPADAALFLSVRIVNLPVVLSTRHGPWLALEGERIEHPVADGASSNV